MQRAARCLLHSLRVGPRPSGQQVRWYYLKKTAKRGPSGQAWLALAGVTTTIAGVSIFLLGNSYIIRQGSTCMLFLSTAGHPEDTIEGLDTVCLYLHEIGSYILDLFYAIPLFSRLRINTLIVRGY